MNDPSQKTDAPAEPSGESSLFKRVEHILSLIRPAVQSDGGDLELVDVTEDGVVRVRFHGACVAGSICAFPLPSISTGVVEDS